MNPISVIENNDILEELKNFPLQAVIWGILDNNNKGQIFKLSDNSVLILETEGDEPYVFLAGPVTSRAVDEVINYLSSVSFPTIYCQPQYHSLFLEKKWDFLLRAEMQLQPNFKPLPIQNGLHIEPINSMGLFKQCHRFNNTSERYGSPEQFLKYGTGYVLRQGEQIVSEAYADYVGGGHIEIGILTHPDYQSQGFASQVASHLVSKCLEQNHTPGWSCQVNNRASINTALKIGFAISRYYIQMVPTRGNTLGEPLVKWIRENPEWNI